MQEIKVKGCYCTTPIRTGGNATGRQESNRPPLINTRRGGIAGARRARMFSLHKDLLHPSLTLIKCMIQFRHILQRDSVCYDTVRSAKFSGTKWMLYVRLRIKLPRNDPVIQNFLPVLLHGGWTVS